MSASERKAFVEGVEWACGDRAHPQADREANDLYPDSPCENIKQIAADVRSLKLAEPHLTNEQIHARLHLPVHVSTVGVIVNNTRHPDPSYTPPVNHMSKCTRAAQPKRLASIDCAFRCPVCGGAYPMNDSEPFQTFNEAQRCCRKAEAR
jgi:hypothetical protein